MKKFLSLLLALTVLASAAGAVDLYVDTDLIDTDTPPAIIDGRTLVPVRTIFEAIGATVAWDSAASTATGVRGDTTVIIQVGNTTAYVNGEPRVLDVPAQLVNGRTMVPARFISEAMDCDVTWDGATGTAAVAYRLNGVKFYAAPAGERYHYDGSCNGGTYEEASLAEINGRKLTPCEECVPANSSGAAAAASGSAGDEYLWTTLPMPVGEVPVYVPGWSPDTAQDNTPSVSGASSGSSMADTVYVSSRSNTIHSVHDCSGMKNYREMTRADADANGYQYCPNCW